MKLRIVGERSRGDGKRGRKMKDKHAFRKRMNRSVRRWLKCKDPDKEITAKIGGYWD